MSLVVTFWLAQSLRAKTIGSEDGLLEVEDGASSLVAGNGATVKTTAAIVTVEKQRDGSTQILLFAGRSSGGHCDAI
jgi:hypothetical protein